MSDKNTIPFKKRFAANDEMRFDITDDEEDFASSGPVSPVGPMLWPQEDQFPPREDRMDDQMQVN